MIFKSFEEEKADMNLNMYKYILEGKQHSFPMGFWTNEGDAELFKTFLLHYIHEVLGYSKEEEVPYKVITKKLIIDTKLIGAYKILFNNRIDVMFKEIFPEAYPFKMPFIAEELWYGKGMWEGYEPLKDTFPKWYITEHLGLTEDNVVGLIDVANDIVDDYRRIIKAKYRSLAYLIHVAFPNKDIEVIKKGIKSRTTSRVALKKRRAKDPNFEFNIRLQIYTSDNNCYFTNSGCNVYMYTKYGKRNIQIINPDRNPTEREINFIKVKLLGKEHDTFFFDTEIKSNEVILTEVDQVDCFNLLNVE